MRLVVTALIAAAVLGFAACGGGKKQEGAATGSSLRTFTVNETDFKLSPPTFTIDQAGTYTFHAVNAGQAQHSLEIEGKGVKAKLDSNLQPGASGDLKVTLPAGTYEIYCPADGHKDMGMKGTVSVAGGGQARPQTTTSNSSNGYGY